MTNDELDELERYVNSCREQKEFNEVSLTKRTALRIIALARIGVAAVEKHQLPSLSEPSLEEGAYVFRAHELARMKTTIGGLIRAYLASRKGE